MNIREGHKRQTNKQDCFIHFYKRGVGFSLWGCLSVWPWWFCLWHFPKWVLLWRLGIVKCVSLYRTGFVHLCLNKSLQIWKPLKCHLKVLQDSQTEGKQVLLLFGRDWKCCPGQSCPEKGHPEKDSPRKGREGKQPKKTTLKYSEMCL